MGNKWEYLRLVRETEYARQREYFMITSPKRVHSDRIKKKFPGVEIREGPTDTVITDTGFKHTWVLEAELLDVLGNEGWEAYAIRSVPNTRQGAEPRDEFYFKRLITTPASGTLEEIHHESRVETGPPRIADESVPQPPPANAEIEAPPIIGQQYGCSLFDVVIVGVPADRKVATIKAVREIKPTVGLAEAKALVETLPSKLFAGVSDSIATAAKKMLEDAGAGVRLDLTAST